MHVFVKTENLSKRYGRVTALDGCSLEVERGEVFGLLGPNGAGKTTLLRLLLGFLRPTSGRAEIDGLDCYRQSVAARQRLAYLPGEARLFRQMRGRDVLRFFAEVRPQGSLSRATELAKRLDLELTRRVAFMSTGMRQKLALACTLGADTPLVILDEPTANLDPNVRAIVMELVEQARHQGRTVIFTSHVLTEVEEVCDRVVILRQGKLVHTQWMNQLRQQHRIVASLEGELPAPPAELAADLEISHNGQGQVAILAAGELAPLLRWLADLSLREVRIEPLGLRTVYERFHRDHELPSSGRRDKGAVSA